MCLQSSDSLDTIKCFEHEYHAKCIGMCISYSNERAVIADKCPLCQTKTSTGQLTWINDFQNRKGILLQRAVDENDFETVASLQISFSDFANEELVVKLYMQSALEHKHSIYARAPFGS